MTMNNIIENIENSKYKCDDVQFDFVKKRIVPIFDKECQRIVRQPNSTSYISKSSISKKRERERKGGMKKMIHENICLMTYTIISRKIFPSSLNVRSSSGSRKLLALYDRWNWIGTSYLLRM